MDFSFYWQLFKRRLPLVIVLAIIGAIAGATLALRMPTIFNSRAVLIVQTAQIPDELAASTVRTGEMEALQIIRQRILSREVLLDLANKLKIYDSNTLMGPDSKVTNMRDRITIETEGGQRTRFGPRDATIMQVGFAADNPKLAATTANELVTLIMQTNLEMRTDVAQQTLDFFSQEVDRYEAQLNKLSAQLLDFQENNLGALPDSLDFRRDQIARLQSNLEDLKRSEATLQDRRAQLVSLFESTGTTQLDAAKRQIQALPQRTLRPAEQRLAQLQAEYEAQVGVLSENNPRMVFLRSQIESAKERVAALPPIEDGNTGEETAKEQASSVFNIQLADIDAQIAYVEDQKLSTQEQITDLNRSIEATPGNAVTLASLQRAYSAAQEQYNQAVSNKAQAQTGTIIESMSRGQRISVIEQAVPPEKPASPNRPLISIAGLGAGAGLGLLIILIGELLNKTIRRPEDLKNQLGIETFATIPYIMTPNAIIARTVRSLLIAVLAVCIVSAALWFVNRNVTPLQPLLERLLSAASLI
ncbi:GumC family protein [Celeribacter neptunius]|uniref:Polysaccharide chain length determinant protein, PEP-CTERM locus subfamily n=1 Tax=Celeribacter neptunius TaxID=588602 RepID=A0A1I3SEW0_9RHOB|nr:hypothetical protein [Celeribacter neptunius]SFJ56006.1 polysaccharide chain length determinant protein, PEP-CTERM locus subfamily [Celeribacter neptunius]